MGAGYKRQRGVLGHCAGHDIRGGARCREAVQALVHQRVHRLRAHTITSVTARGPDQRRPPPEHTVDQLHHTLP